MDQVLETVKWLLDVLTPENIDHCCVAIASCIGSSSTILKGVISLILDRAVHESSSCPMYAKLCAKLNEKLPAFPPEEIDGEEITFNRVLLQNCQQIFEGVDKMCDEVKQMTTPDQEVERRDKARVAQLHTRMSFRLIGELWELKLFPENIAHIISEELLGNNKDGRLEVENTEAISQLFRTFGKLQVDESPISRHGNDVYSDRLKELAKDAELVIHQWFVVRSIVLLRANNWNSTCQAGSAKEDIEPPRNKPAPPIVEKPLPTTPSPTINQDGILKRKTVSLLEEYFSVRLLGKALKCIEELKSPAYHPEVVKEAISLGLEKNPPCIEPVKELLGYLFVEKVITADDIADGCISYGSLIDDVGIDLPEAPNHFGQIIGLLVLDDRLDFIDVKEVLEEIHGCNYFREAILNAIIEMVESSRWPEELLNAQASEIDACYHLL